MKFRDILLLCSVSFAAGMVVPFALLDMNARNTNSSANKGSTVSVLPTQQSFALQPAAVEQRPKGATEVKQIPAPAKVLVAQPATKSLGVNSDQPVRDGEVDTDIAEKSFVGLTADNPDLITEDVVSAADVNIIGDIQTELLIRGYKPGVVDGKLGPGTRSAIKALQRDLGFPESGTIDQAILGVLNIKLETESLVKVNGVDTAVPTSAPDVEPKLLTPDPAPQNAGAPIRLNNFQQ